MSRISSLSTRLTLAILLPLSVLLLISAIYETFRDQKTMIEMAETGAANLAGSVVEELQGIMRSSKTAIDGLAIPISQQAQISAEAADQALATAIEQFPLIYGSALALDRGADVTLPPFARYAFRDGEEVITSSLEDDEYRYWEQSWFSDTLSLNEPNWTDPYLDEGGGDVRMVTYARPLSIGNRRAVMTADLRLTFINVIAAGNILGKAGAVLVFDASGELVMHPREQWILQRSLADLAEEHSVPALAQVPAAISRGERVWLRPKDGMHAGIIADRSDLPGRLYARPLNEAGWGVAVYFSDHDFLTTIASAQRYKLVFSLVTLLLLAVLIIWVTRRSLRPVGELALRTREIARGDFAADTPGQERSDEIGRLSRAFHLMQEHLQNYVTDLTQATAERERLQAELETARQIQQMLLPAETPADPEISLVCMLRPARTVGGDLYYYRQRANNRILFAIGDVSDKGVPAALFMAKAMAVLEAAASQALAPAQILDSINVALTEDNDLCMFVTVLVGELDVSTGYCRLASAGHEYPIRVGDSEADMVEIPTGPPVGLDEDNEFVETGIALQPGECLFVYTDGITDARDPRGTMFGDERLLDTLNTDNSDSPARVLAHTLNDVDEFVDGADQADDMALLILQWLPKTGEVETEETADLTGVSTDTADSTDGQVNSGAIDYAVKRGCHNVVTDTIRQNLKPVDPEDLELVVEEILTNVVKYAGLDDNQTGRVEWELSQQQLRLTFSDPGIAFDPLEEKEPDAGSDGFSEGGMGIMLIRHMADSIQFERQQERNVLTISIPL